MKKIINVFFPEDTRRMELRNSLLDGCVHQIEIGQISTFERGVSQFYIVNGYDKTRNCGIQILLVKEGNLLKKVPLLDYRELSNYEYDARTLDEDEIELLLENSSHYASSMPLTTIYNVIKEHEKLSYNGVKEEAKDKILVFCDRDGRRFLLSSVAEYIGLTNPVSIKYLPIKYQHELASMYGIYPTAGFRLLTDLEYSWISKKYIVDKGLIDNVDVVECDGEAFVHRITFENNRWGLERIFYVFNSEFNDCVRLNRQQRQIVETFYSIDWHWEKIKRVNDNRYITYTPEKELPDFDDENYRRINGFN